MKNKAFLYILLVLFLVFLALYYSSNAGIIDYQSKYKKELTEEQIKKFEEDVKNNVSIDIKDYIVKTEEEYNNNLSKITLKISNTIGEKVKDTLDFIFNNFEKAMKD